MHAVLIQWTPNYSIPFPTDTVVKIKLGPSPVVPPGVSGC